MRNIVLFLLLVLVALSAGAQTVQRIRPIGPAASTPVPAEAGVASLPKDYEALYRKEAEKARELRAEVQSLTARLAEVTRPGGSLVQAYCESPTMSRNTAGAGNDCATSGFACEPVSGLCRTSARSSLECAPGFVYCATRANCVRTAEECQ
jgi:hypothetical protein